MVNAIAWIDTNSAIDFNDALSLAAALGGVLLTEPADVSLTTLRDYLDREETAVWLSDGAAPPVVTQASALLIDFTSAASIIGTVGNDLFVGGPGPGRTLRAGPGDDSYVGGAGGGTIVLGSGNDSLVIRELEGIPWTHSNMSVSTLVYDGDGADSIDGDAALVVVSAAIDGDNDRFTHIGRLSYSPAVAGLTARIDGNPLDRAGIVTGGGIGQDRFQFLTELVGGSGDDDLQGVARLQGGAGDDVLRPGGLTGYFPVTWAAYAEGGDGDDTLYTFSLAKAELRGGAGNDTLMLFDDAKVSGGSGSDSFIFKAPAQVTINDWAPGDVIDISALVDGSIDTLLNDGHLMIKRSGGYTQLLLDQGGGGDSYVLLSSLKGVFSAAALHDWILT